MDNLDLNYLFQKIRDDFELADSQINHVIDATIASGFNVDNIEAFCEIVYDACSRIATCEINADRNLRYNYHFPYNEIVHQSINYYQKEHNTKK